MVVVVVEVGVEVVVGVGVEVEVEVVLTTNHMSEQTPALATKQPVAVGQRGIEIKTLDDMWRFATAVKASGLAPKGIETPEAILIAVQMGLEVGLTPMAALQNIAVVNGRPTIWGDAQLAVVRGTGELESFDEWFEAAGKRLTRNPSNFSDDVTAVCRVKRRGYDAKEFGFSVSDAKRANLWAKQGPWTQYPARMLKYRARSFVLRDEFGDALRGLKTTEEMQDEKPATLAGPVETVSVGDVSTVVVEKPVEKPTDTPQEIIEHTISSAGYTFEDYNEACKRKKLLPIEGAFFSFRDIPLDTAKRHVRVLGDIINAIKASKEVAP